MANVTSKTATFVLAGLVLGGVGFFISKPSLAQTKPAAAASDNQKNSSGVTIENAPAVVVKTEPRAGDDQVDPSITELKVTFSKPMLDGSWSWAQASDDSFPKTTGKPHYDTDKRTCILPVKLEPGKTYVLLLNRPPFTNFMDANHRKAVEYWLVFQTKK